MSTIVATKLKTQDSVQQAVTISQATVFTFSGNATAYITEPGGNKVAFNGQTYEARQPGEYIIEIQGACQTGVVCSANMLLGAESCANAFNVNLCELQQILDALTDIETAILDQQDFQVITTSWVCDPNTNTHVRTITPYVDGVAGAVQTIDSGVDCSQPAPVEYDIETIRYCNPATDTIWVRAFTFVTNNNVTTEQTLSDADTGIDCSETDQTFTNISSISYCNTTTSTLWVRATRYTTIAGVTTETLVSDTDTLIPCDVNTGLADQTHGIVYGVGTSVPAGFKTVSVWSTSGLTILDGVYELGESPIDDIILPQGQDFDATVAYGARGLLPAISIAGGTWQWSAILPINEV